MLAALPRRYAVSPRSRRPGIGQGALTQTSSSRIETPHRVLREQAFRDETHVTSRPSTTYKLATFSICSRHFVCAYWGDCYCLQPGKGRPCLGRGPRRKGGTGEEMLLPVSQRYGSVLPPRDEHEVALNLTPSSRVENSAPPNLHRAQNMHFFRGENARHNRCRSQPAELTALAFDRDCEGYSSVIVLVFSRARDAFVELARQRTQKEWRCIGGEMMLPLPGHTHRIARSRRRRWAPTPGKPPVWGLKECASPLRGQAIVTSEPSARCRLNTLAIDHDLS